MTVLAGCVIVVVELLTFIAVIAGFVIVTTLALAVVVIVDAGWDFVTVLAGSVAVIVELLTRVIVEASTVVVYIWADAEHTVDAVVAKLFVVIRVPETVVVIVCTWLWSVMGANCLWQSKASQIYSIGVLTTMKIQTAMMKNVDRRQ